MEKETKYSERYRFWTDKAITQLGYSINLFTTVGIAFLGYLINGKSKFPQIEVFCGIKLYHITVILIFLSVFAGFSAILSRLYDLRITRRIVYFKKKKTQTIQILLY